MHTAFVQTPKWDAFRRLFRNTRAGRLRRRIRFGNSCSDKSCSHYFSLGGSAFDRQWGYNNGALDFNQQYIVCFIGRRR